jgi:hypothetical protein
MIGRQSNAISTDLVPTLIETPRILNPKLDRQLVARNSVIGRPGG